MKKLSLVIIISFLMFIGCSDSSTNQENNISPIPINGINVLSMVNVDEVVSDFMTDNAIPGGSIAIVKDGRLVYARGFGYADKESGEVVQPSHLFRIASISKPITSVAILKLSENGQLDIEDQVFGIAGILTDSIYSQFKDTRVEDIKIKHLLQHTSGWGSISGNIDPMFFDRNIAFKMDKTLPIDQATIIEYMLITQNLENDPGTDYKYSNFGYCILGRVIEKVSGMPYEDYVKSLLIPLGAKEMQIGRGLYEHKSSNEVKYYDLPGASLTKTVYGYGEDVPWPYGGFNIEAMDSHGGWIASPTDLLRFLVAVDGEDTKPDILSNSSIQMMTTPSGVEGSRYALGWDVNSVPNWWHIGSLPGTSSILVRTSRGLYWAVVFNTRPKNWRNFNLEMDNMMWEAVNGVSIWPDHDLFN